MSKQPVKKWWVLAATGISTLMVAIDFTIVNLALSDIQRELNVSFSQLQWIMAAYGLTFATFLITAGRLGDLYGRRRILNTGVIGFGIASLIAGLTHFAAILIAEQTHTDDGGVITAAALTVLNVFGILALAITGVVFRYGAWHYFYHQVTAQKIKLVPAQVAALRSLIVAPEQTRAVLDKNFDPALANHLQLILKQAFVFGFHQLTALLLIITLLAGFSVIVAWHKRKT